MNQRGSTEALDVLVEACPSFGATGWLASYLASFEDAGTPDAFVRASALAHHVIELIAAREVDEIPAVLAVVDRLLDEGDRDARDVASLGFLEPLRNIVSHEDVPVSPGEVASLLGSSASAVWTRNGQLWEDAARTRIEGPHLGEADYIGIIDPNLRRYFQAHKRRMDDGTLLGEADVVRFEQGRRPSAPAAGERHATLPWGAIAVAVVLLVVVALTLVR
jgi:hypothetical protein